MQEGSFFKRRKKLLLFLVIGVVLVILVMVNMRARQERALSVQAEEVEKRSLSMVISASGSLRPKRQVDISARSLGKVTRVAVKEGDYVKKGQFLLEIDPVEIESLILELEAALEAAKSLERQTYVQMQQAKNDLDRTLKLSERGYLTSQEVDRAQTNYDIAVSNHEAAKHQIAQREANLGSAKHNLKDVKIVAEMEGIVTRLNVEEGESAIMGTLNNPGTVLLTVADLSTIEVEVEVDETEVIHIALGNEAKVTLDAFPDTSYVGEVTEIGNSPILTSSATGQQGVDFNVVITVRDTIPSVRPGLSADTEITVAERDSALSIPIQSLTVRRNKDLKGFKSSDSLQTKEGETDIEGVFVIENGRAHFKPVKVGISSQKYFEVLSGLEGGEKVVSGNYRAIRDLKDEQRVKVSEKVKKE